MLIQHIMWGFKNYTSTQQAGKEFSNVYGQGILTDHQVWNQFVKSSSIYVSLRDEPWPGQPSDLNQDALRKLMKCNSYKSAQKLTFDHNKSYSLSVNAWKSRSDQAGQLGSS